MLESRRGRVLILNRKLGDGRWKIVAGRRGQGAGEREAKLVSYRLTVIGKR
jgi:hypothetical protein